MDTIITWDVYVNAKIIATYKGTLIGVVTKREFDNDVTWLVVACEDNLIREVKAKDAKVDRFVRQSWS